ncbi:hypothetical protein HY061_00315 [Candidatus Azambacteria bacterium]|nr:hypothetical protein [Candidatus Azambacteria bacterium]
MKTDQKQFNNSLRTFRNIRLTDASKSRIFSKVIAHAQTRNTNNPMMNPYFFIANFFRQPLMATLVLLFFISGGTILAAQVSLPGDFLYSVKTKITEPLTRLTKLNKPAQAAFALKLLDRRIEEMWQLAEKDQMTELAAKENFRLFEKEIQQYKQSEQDINSNDSFKSVAKVNSRLEDYDDLVSAVPQLTTFYQDSTKALLQLAVPVMEISQETSDLRDNDDFEDEKNSSNIMESNV